MPIQNITQGERRQSNSTAGMAFLGTINKGAEKPANGPGLDLDYFRFSYSQRFERLKPHVQRIYGEKPKEFGAVWILGNSVEEAFPNWYEERDLNGKRVCRRCDGVQQQMWFTPDGKQFHVANGTTPLACLGGLPSEKGGRKVGQRGGCDVCKTVGRMNIMLVDLLAQTGVLGYWVLKTGSPRDIENIFGALNFVADANVNVRAVTFRLGRTPGHGGWRPYVKDGQTKVSEVEKAFLYLEPTEETAAMIAQKKALEAGITLSMAFGLTAGELHGAPQLTEKVATAPNGDNGAQNVAQTVAEDEIADAEFEESDEADLAAEEPELDGEVHYARDVYVQKDRRDKFSYVLRCSDGSKFTLFESALFKAVSIDMTGWKEHGHVHDFEPPLMVMVQDGKVLRLQRQDALPLEGK